MFTRQQDNSNLALAIFVKFADFLLSRLEAKKPEPSVEHILFEHYPDGTSRIVGRFLDNRLDISPEEIEARATRQGEEQVVPSFEARRAFLACDYIDIRNLPKPPARPEPNSPASADGNLTLT